MKVETNPNKTNIEITSGQSCVKFNTREQTTEVMGLKSNVKGPSAEWEWSTKEDKANKVQTIDENSTEVQYPSAKCVYDAIQNIPGGEQIQTDWEQEDQTQVDYIKNKPTIPVVPTNVSAFTNDAGYITLTDVPAQAQSDWSQTDNQAVDYIKNKPTIPAAQVNSDWNSSSGVSEILNKPDLTLKEDKSNKVTSISSGSTDTQYPSALAVYNFVPKYIHHTETIDTSSMPVALRTQDFTVGDTHIYHVFVSNSGGTSALDQMIFRVNNGDTTGFWKVEQLGRISVSQTDYYCKILSRNGDYAYTSTYSVEVPANNSINISFLVTRII